MTDSKYVDGYHEEPTGGLFGHVNTEASVERVCVTLTNLGRLAPDQVKEHFGRISNKYWDRKNFAEREKAAPFIDEMNTITSMAGLLADKLEHATPVVRGKLVEALHRSKLQLPRPKMVSLLGFLRLLSMEKAPAGREQGRPPQLHIDYLVKEVARAWPLVFGLRLSISFRTALGRDGREFVSQSARNLLSICQAVDPTVRFAQVKTAVNNLRREDLD